MFANLFKYLNIFFLGFNPIFHRNIHRSTELAMKKLVQVLLKIRNLYIYKKNTKITAKSSCFYGAHVLNYKLFYHKIILYCLCITLYV